MICDKCQKQLKYARDVVDDPFMYCPTCLCVYIEKEYGKVNHGTQER